MNDIIKQKQIMQKFFTAKNYMILLSFLGIYYFVRGYYDITVMLLFLLIIFDRIRVKLRREMLEPLNDEEENGKEKEERYY